MIGIVHLLLLLQMTGKHATEISRGADIPYLGIGSCKSSNDNSEKGFKGDPSLIAADRVLAALKAALGAASLSPLNPRNKAPRPRSTPSLLSLLRNHYHHHLHHHGLVFLSAL